VNESALSFSVPRDGEIRFGLGGVKGVGEAAVEAILESRKERIFASLFDFCDRVDLRRVNKKVLEALVKSGAFDDMGPTGTVGYKRAALFAAIEKSVERGQAAQRDRASGQASLFAAMAPKPGTAAATADALPALSPEAEWSEKEMLANEKETLGFYISGHPLQQYHQEIKRYASKSLAHVQQSNEGERVTVVAVAAAVTDRMTKTGKRMGIVTLEDMTGSLRMVCFSAGRPGQAGYEQWEGDLKSDDALVITGQVTVNSRPGEEEQSMREIKAEEVTRLSEIRQRKTKKVAFKVPADKVTAERLVSLKQTLVKHAGDTPVSFEVVVPGQSAAVIKLIELRVRPTDALLHDVNRLFGGQVAELS